MNAVHFENEASSVRLKTLLFTKTLGGYFMQAIVETVFDACYLIGVVTLGILMIAKSHGNKQYRLFGIMAVVLGFGDAFHLVPRAVALCTTGLDNFTVADTKKAVELIAGRYETESSGGITFETIRDYGP